MLQSSVEYLHIPLTGPDVDTVTAADLQIAIQARGLPPTAWLPVTGYVAGKILHLVGPGTAQGALPLGTCSAYVRVTSAPETPVLKAGDVLVTAT